MESAMHLHSYNRRQNKRSDMIIQRNENVPENEISSQLRQLYNLPPITEMQSESVVEELRGVLKTYGNDEEDSVDAVKSARESIC